MLSKLEELIDSFTFLIKNGEIEIYNEFSLQHELGIYLRNKIADSSYKVQFERNVSYFGINKGNLVKKEIDISIFNEDKSKKYAVELKYPRNGQYPESMFSFTKDIKFCEQLTQSGFNGAFAFTIVDDTGFYQGAFDEGIYKHFRNSHPLAGTIIKPTGLRNEIIPLNGKYSVTWKDIVDSYKYYTVVISKNESEDIINQLDTPIIKIEKKSVQSNLKTKNMEVNDIADYIRQTIRQAQHDNKETVEFISGNLHKELGLKNAMPTVCSAMYKVMNEYHGSEMFKPQEVKKFSSTIRIVYKIR